MKLFWKDLEIPIGSSIQVIEAGGDGVPRIWKILEIREKNLDEEYYEPASGKCFALKKIMKSKRLFRKREEGDLIHIPPCSFYLVIEESCEGKPPTKRCFNADFLSTLMEVKTIS